MVDAPQPVLDEPEETFDRLLARTRFKEEPLRESAESLGGIVGHRRQTTLGGSWCSNQPYTKL